MKNKTKSTAPKEMVVCHDCFCISEEFVKINGSFYCLDVHLCATNYQRKILHGHLPKMTRGYDIRSQQDQKPNYQGYTQGVLL